MAGAGAGPGEKSPKKARFQLAKGIREPGRDSLGDGRVILPVDSDSDDLEII
jgi:minichromosome maintenance protein 10